MLPSAWMLPEPNAALAVEPAVLHGDLLMPGERRRLGHRHGDHRVRVEREVAIVDHDRQRGGEIGLNLDAAFAKPGLVILHVQSSDGERIERCDVGVGINVLANLDSVLLNVVEPHVLDQRGAEQCSEG